MNNAKIALDSLENLPVIDREPLLRHREQILTEQIEALGHILGSNYWKILQKDFALELESLTTRLIKEKDVTEMHRLQGRIEQAGKLDLEKTLVAKRNELVNIRNQYPKDN